MIYYKQNKASKSEIKLHFSNCDFKPNIETYIDIDKYIKKILKYSKRFEIWDNDLLIGFAAAYFNDYKKKEGFITNIGINSRYTNKGFATELIDQISKFGAKNKFTIINLEVDFHNKKVINFYKKNNFKIKNKNKEKILMYKTI
jgi:ribosomal protein S18 acetylase RimI-like enzyme